MYKDLSFDLLTLLYKERSIEELYFTRTHGRTRICINADTNAHTTPADML